QLRTGIKQALHQTNQKYDTQDGMDMAFCVLNLETNLLSFSGAYNPLYLIRESELVEYKADRMPIGIHPKDTASFTATEIQLQKNDRFYLFSDGYVSQFGGQKEEKFKSNRFKELLLKIHNQPFAEQLETLNQSISVWQGSNAQTDDMLVMGVGIE
ncbi:MAG TPA: pas/pac sensor protein, partial [Bacteroidales bacterium]|nr:pas/pac sensor protein [Bacteroidales bacterium]